jgi:hypothetical protein
LCLDLDESFEILTRVLFDLLLAIEQTLLQKISLETGKIGFQGGQPNHCNATVSEDGASLATGF